MICVGEKVTKDNVWHCKRLESKRRGIDAKLAEANPEDFTPAMRTGVACAMNADPRKTYWGMPCNDLWCQKKMGIWMCEARRS